MENYSTEDLILYIYGESTADQTQEISRAIQNDWQLREKYQALKESIQGLSSLVKGPRQQTIDAIMNYAKATSEVPTQ